MNCQENLKLMENLLNRDGGDSQVAALRDHNANCPSCQQEWDGLCATGKTLKGLNHVPVPHQTLWPELEKSIFSQTAMNGAKFPWGTVLSMLTAATILLVIWMNNRPLNKNQDHFEARKDQKKVKAERIACLRKWERYPFFLKDEKGPKPSLQLCFRNEKEAKAFWDNFYGNPDLDESRSRKAFPFEEIDFKKEMLLGFGRLKPDYPLAPKMLPTSLWKTGDNYEWFIMNHEMEWGSTTPTHNPEIPEHEKYEYCFASFPKIKAAVTFKEVRVRSYHPGRYELPEPAKREDFITIIRDLKSWNNYWNPIEETGKAPPFDGDYIPNFKKESLVVFDFEMLLSGKRAMPEDSNYNFELLDFDDFDNQLAFHFNSFIVPNSGILDCQPRPLVFIVPGDASNVCARIFELDTENGTETTHLVARPEAVKDTPEPSKIIPLNIERIHQENLYGSVKGDKEKDPPETFILRSEQEASDFFGKHYYYCDSDEKIGLDVAAWYFEADFAKQMIVGTRVNIFKNQKIANVYSENGKIHLILNEYPYAGPGIESPKIMIERGKHDYNWAIVDKAEGEVVIDTFSLDQYHPENAGVNTHGQMSWPMTVLHSQQDWDWFFGEWKGKDKPKLPEDRNFEKHCVVVLNGKHQNGQLYIDSFQYDKDALRLSLVWISPEMLSENPKLEIASHYKELDPLGVFIVERGQKKVIARITERANKGNAENELWLSLVKLKWNEKLDKESDILALLEQMKIHLSRSELWAAARIQTDIEKSLEKSKNPGFREKVLGEIYQLTGRRAEFKEGNIVTFKAKVSAVRDLRQRDGDLVLIATTDDGLEVQVICDGGMLQPINPIDLSFAKNGMELEIKAKVYEVLKNKISLNATSDKAFFVRKAEK